jgi:NADPH:quinone reductase-like Zn-dependent oxidoreductase
MVPTPRFDPQAEPRSVLLRKRGFSLNYRDRGIALQIAKHQSEGDFFPIGSDFVAEVLACGSDVTELSPGDRVIPDSAYPNSGEPGVRGGIPVNSASREFQVIPAVKLMRIPPAMSDAVAAGFTIGAQTAMAMERRVDAPAGGAVLVTSARSNTALFSIAALRRRNLQIHAATRSDQCADRYSPKWVPMGCRTSPPTPNASVCCRRGEVTPRSSTRFSTSTCWHRSKC